MTTDEADSVVHLADHRRVLELYAEAMAGRPIGIRELGAWPQSLRLVDNDRPSSIADSVYLPDSVDAAASSEGNFRIYKIALLHQLAIEEIATTSFDDAEMARRHSSLPSARPSAPGATSFERFFARFRRSAVARSLFSLFEDVRADSHLERSYAGARDDLAKVMAVALAARPALHTVPPRLRPWEQLLRSSLGEPLDPTATGTGIASAQELDRLVDGMRQSGADVYTAAAATLAAYQLLSRAPIGRTANPEGGHAEEAGDEPAVTVDATVTEGGEADSVPFRGDFQPELRQQIELLDALEGELERLDDAGGRTPLASLPDGESLEINGISDGDADGSGQPSTDLETAADGARSRLSALRQQHDDLTRRLRPFLEARSKEGSWSYDEWDYKLGGYRRRWCTLRETVLPGDDDTALRAALDDSLELARRVRRNFELLRPEVLRRVRRLPDGEDIDLDAAVESLIDRRAGGHGGEGVYQQRRRRERDVAAVFLLDMSASTDSEIVETTPAPSAADANEPRPSVDYAGILGDDDDWASLTRQSAGRPKRRVIDIEKESVALMAEALETLGDAYAIYGFSGFGRERVDFFVAKEFGDRWGSATLARVAAMKPQRSTRMGASIRHAVRKLERRDNAIKALVIVSDGYPQDFDYGDDRSSRTYGIQDTMVALREAERSGIHSFCITVDPAGHDYLREMCPDRRYLVIDEISALPAELPKVYRALTS